MTELTGTNDVYRFVVQSKKSGDARSLGYLGDAHALGLHQVMQIECFDLYFIRGSLGEAALKQLAQQVLHDPVTQKIEIQRLQTNGRPWEWGRMSDSLTQGELVDVVLRPGVTDPVGEQIMRIASMMGIEGIDATVTGLRFIVRGQNITTGVLTQLAQRLFSNNVIQRYTLGEILPTFPEAAGINTLVDTLCLRGLSDEGLMQVSQERRAALNLEEMKAIQAYCEMEKRDLTDIEFEMLAQTWSEHCVHKTFKSQVRIMRKDGADSRYPGEYAHLFNQTIRAATERIRAPWVRSAFRDNAGIVAFTEDTELSFKVETHNHPSAIEPFGGANTGLGGVIRDILGVSARPIASTDILCFGPQDTQLDDLQAGVLHPHRIASGVVAGIEDYGNKMGIPTVNGAVWYDAGFTANPLVFCGSVGLAPRDSHPNAVQAGDRIIILGGRTGRDGLRGATFSSMTMDAQTGEVSGASVQIGAPVVEKGLVDVLMQARDRKLYHAITDCGAGGLSSAVGEMASDCGGDVQLERVRLKYPGLAPWEIWLSEAQERMVVAVALDDSPALREICDLYEVELTDIGEFNFSGRLRVFHGENLVLDLDNDFLHHGIPQRKYTAEIRPPRYPAGWMNPQAALAEPPNDVLKRLLAHANIASKEAIIRKYDCEVQSSTVIKPLSGVEQDGPSDGAVIKPISVAGETAFVLSNGLNPEYGKFDPYEMTWLAIDEALRNAVACGADPAQIAILDNFCWGDPTRPQTMGDLVQAAQACFDAAVHYGTPFISGKDSFNNEYLGQDGQRYSIPPTLLISAIGRMNNWQTRLTMDLKTPGNRVYLVGDFQPTLGGSHFNLVTSQVIEEGVPKCSWLNPQVFAALHQANQAGLVQACHDLSEGGLSVAAAEMALAGRCGLSLQANAVLNTPRFLFGESSGCFLVEVAQPDEERFNQIFADLPCQWLGTVTAGDDFEVAVNSIRVINLPLAEILAAWKGAQE